MYMNSCFYILENIRYYKMDKRKTFILNHNNDHIASLSTESYKIYKNITIMLLLYELQEYLLLMSI